MEKTNTKIESLNDYMIDIANKINFIDAMTKDPDDPYFTQYTDSNCGND